MKDRDRGERIKRDAALKRVKNNPNNNYDAISDGVRKYLRGKTKLGERGIVSPDVFRAVMEKSPNIKPQEKRVMGPVMRAMRGEKLITPIGTVTRGSHRGLVTEWKRTYVP